MTPATPTVFDVEADTHCRNCGAVLSGRYCQSCGQRAKSVLLSFRDLLQEGLHEYLHIDGKIARTMRLLLFSPGALTREFIEGRRVRYISPVRLYLIWSVAFFWLLSVTPQRPIPKVPEPPTVASSAGPSGGKWSDRLLQYQAGGIKKDMPALLNKIKKWWPSVMFALVPVFGLLVMLAYRKAVGFYLPHLYFAIHVHAFIFFTLLASELTSVAASLATGVFLHIVRAINFVLKFLPIPYTIVALHRVYGGSWLSDILRGIAMIAAYSAVVLAAMIVVSVVAFLTLV